MPLTTEQISGLLGMIATVEPDSLDCDSCFEYLAEFAEAELASREIPEALKAVEIHLQQCMCCQDEYRALLEALRALEES